MNLRQRETLPHGDTAHDTVTKRESGASPQKAGRVFRFPRKPRGGILYWAAVGWIALIVFFAIFAKVLPLHRYDGIVPGLPARSAPGWRAEFLGTDIYGRSTLSRIIFAARSSMEVGILSVLVSTTAGLVIGMTAGFFRGVIDEAIGVVLDAVMAIPALVLLLALAALGRHDALALAIELALVSIPSSARLARATTLSLAGRDDIVAARVMGATNFRIMTRELLPNVALRLSSFAFLLMGLVLVAEGSLSFLGLGIQPPSPSWGGMISDGEPYLQTKPYLVFVPVLFLFLTVTAFTIIGDRARRRFDNRGSALS
jgi:peptide/nickel transport system permease protein